MKFFVCAIAFTLALHQVSGQLGGEAMNQLFGSMMGSMGGLMGSMGGSSSLMRGPPGGGGGGGGEEMGDEEDMEIIEEDYDGQYSQRHDDFGNPGGLDMDWIVSVMNSAVQILKNLPDMKGIIPVVMNQGLHAYQRFMLSLPGNLRKLRPAISRIVEDVKENMRDIEAQVLKMKKKMTGKKDLVDLDLIERTASFCPGYNLTLVRHRSRLSWRQFGHQLLDQCVSMGCDGKYDLCCPYINDTTGNSIKATCVYSQRKHYGSCPSGYKSALIDQAAIIFTLSNPESRPSCNRDSDCKVTEKCCMSQNFQDKDTTASYARCMASVVFE